MFIKRMIKKQFRSFGIRLAFIMALTFILFPNFVISKSFFISKSQANDEHVIILQSTTSTDNSGLLDYLLPKFYEQTGITVKTVAVGTGQAIANARNGDGDVLLVHAKAAEEAFVASGYGVERHELMYNDFIIIGPKDDPANIRELKTIDAVMKRFFETEAMFISRGDDSGTHKKELSLWQSLDLKPNGAWYLSSGSSMGATINMAVSIDGYTLSDRATWLTFGNKGEHEILFAGDPKIHNQYGVILVNQEKHPHINAKDGQIFIDWLLSDIGQQTINSYTLNGMPLFIANAK